MDPLNHFHNSALTGAFITNPIDTELSSEPVKDRKNKKKTKQTVTNEINKLYCMPSLRHILLQKKVNNFLKFATYQMNTV